MNLPWVGVGYLPGILATLDCKMVALRRLGQIRTGNVHAHTREGFGRGATSARGSAQQAAQDVAGKVTRNVKRAVAGTLGLVGERMTKVDTAWLRRDCDANLMMIVGVWQFAPGVKYAAVCERIENTLLPYDRFRQRVIEDTAGATWVHDRNFELKNHVVLEKLPKIAKGQGQEIRAMVPVNLRPPHQANDPAHKRGNRFGLVPLVLPIGVDNPVERVYDVRRRMVALKGSYQPLLAFSLLAVAGLLIRPAQDVMLNLFAKKTTAVMTNVPGPARQAEVLRLGAGAKHVLGAAVGRCGGGRVDSELRRRRAVRRHHRQSAVPGTAAQHWRILAPVRQAVYCDADAAVGRFGLKFSGIQGILG